MAVSALDSHDAAPQIKGWAERMSAAPSKGHTVAMLAEIAELRAELVRRSRTAPPPTVAWAVTSERGGIHKLAITPGAALAKAEKWRKEWPNNKCSVRPLAFADAMLAERSK